MQITRHNHLRYILRLTPLLVGLYVLQVILYKKFAPSHLSEDITMVLGVGLAAIILLYHFYDQHHKITLKENYLETRFDVLKMKEEVLYQNVVYIELKKSKHYYGKVSLHTRDGSVCHLHHVDSPEMIVQYIEKKRSKHS